MSGHGHRHTPSVSQNQKAQLANAYNELGKELSSTKIKVVGNYTLGKVIGEGAYGKVRLGTHRLNSTRVAIKQIPKAMSATLTREIHHHRQLHHPHVTQLYEVIATESSIWLVTELCCGGELFDYLAEKGRLSEEETKIIFGQLCLAVAYIHDKGIVHRDLKLENVLLDERCRVKLGDFGFTREFEKGAFMETFCGTTGYASPEMLLGKKYLGPEVDVWSLGVILYTLLTGTLPFDDDDEGVMRDKIINEDFEDPDWLSSESRDLIKNILNKDPTQRLTISQILSHAWFNTRHEERRNSCISTSSLPLVPETRSASPTTEVSDLQHNSGASASASSEQPSGPVTPDNGSGEHVSVVEQHSIHRNPSEDTIKRTDDALHEAVLEAAKAPKARPHPETVQEEDVSELDASRLTSNSRPDLPRSNSNPSRGPLGPPARTPARTKRRSVSSTLSDPSDTDSKPLASLPPQDFASLLSTPAPIIFSTPLERELLNTLSSAGIDTGQLVHSVLSNACDSSGALWWMLIRKAERKAVEEGAAEKVLYGATTTTTTTGKVEEEKKRKSDEGKRNRPKSNHGREQEEDKSQTPTRPRAKSSAAPGVVQVTPNLTFVPPTPTMPTSNGPSTPPLRAKSPTSTLLSPSPSSLSELGINKSLPSTPGGSGSKSRKGRSGSVSIMQRATTALEAAGLVRKKSTEGVKEPHDRERDRDREREKDKEREKEKEKEKEKERGKSKEHDKDKKVVDGDESRSSHGSAGSTKQSRSPPLQSSKDSVGSPTPSGEFELNASQSGSSWIVSNGKQSSTQGPEATPTSSPGDTLRSLPNIDERGSKVGNHRNRASLLNTFRMWFQEDRKGKRKATPPGYGHSHSLSVATPSSNTNRNTVKRRVSGGGRQRGYHSKRHSASSRRSSSVNSRRSSTASMQMPMLAEPQPQRHRSDPSRRSFGSHTPNSELESRPSSVQSFSVHHHRKSPSASSVGSRTASPLKNYHRRGGSGSSTRVVRMHPAHGSSGGGSSGHPRHIRSNSTTSSLTSSRPGSFYEQSESEGQRTASPVTPYYSRRSLEDTPKRSAFVAQKRHTPLASPNVGGMGRSSWKKSWGLEPPGWQTRQAHLPIEVLAISPVGGGPMSIRDVFSGKHASAAAASASNGGMGDEDDWVDEDEEGPAFVGGLGQTSTTASSGSSGSHLLGGSAASSTESFMLSPLPRFTSGRAGAGGVGGGSGGGVAAGKKRNNRNGGGSAAVGRGKGHSPAGRVSPLPAPAESPFEETRGNRRALPNGHGRSAGAVLGPVTIQEEDEGEEE